MTEHPSSLEFNEKEVVVIVKAAPRVGDKHGETVCCAGIDRQQKWVRLFPVSFRMLDAPQQFGRWDLVKFRSRKPKDDNRVESVRVEQNTLEIIGNLKKPERGRFLAGSIVSSLEKERSKDRSLALLKVEVQDFLIERKQQDKIEMERAQFKKLREQGDMFQKSVIPYKPCPFVFKYKYTCEDGHREGSCQDWEIEATFFRWANMYGEKEALIHMKERFGTEYPQQGMLLAMGTHSRFPDRWLINGVVRLDEVRQGELFR